MGHGQAGSCCSCDQELDQSRLAMVKNRLRQGSRRWGAPVATQPTDNQ
jgi:hypothetical protein